jgi:hypothetical protein
MPWLSNRVEPPGDYPSNHELMSAKQFSRVIPIRTTGLIKFDSTLPLTERWVDAA